MKLIQCMMTNSQCYKYAGISKKTGIVVHSTGAVNTALKRYVQPMETDTNYAVMIEELGKNQYENDWNHSNRRAGVHAFIGHNAKGEIKTCEVLPYEKDAWGVGNGLLMPAGTAYYMDERLTQKIGTLNSETMTSLIEGNPKVTYFKNASGTKCYCYANSGLSYNFSPNARIQFEICEGDINDADYFYAVMKEAQEYCAYLCKKFGWSVNQICSHYESYHAGYGCNHGDPDHWMENFGKDMNWFRGQVAQMMLFGNNETKTEPKEPANEEASNGIPVVEEPVIEDPKQEETNVETPEVEVPKVELPNEEIDDGAEVESPVDVEKTEQSETNTADYGIGRLLKMLIKKLFELILRLFKK